MIAIVKLEAQGLTCVVDYVGIRRNGGKGTSDFICTYTSNRSDLCRASAGRRTLTESRLSRPTYREWLIEGACPTHDSRVFRDATRNEPRGRLSEVPSDDRAQHSRAILPVWCPPFSPLGAHWRYLVSGIWYLAGHWTLDIDFVLDKVTGHSAGCLPTPESGKAFTWLRPPIRTHLSLVCSTGI